MKAKNIIIFLIIVSILGGGYYLFQIDKQNKELVIHNKMKFQKIMAAAKKSSPVGLDLMAIAINKYHQQNGHYPKTLMELYPEFISDKLFISELNWSYLPNNKTYLLKKSLTGQKTFASIGPNMRIKMGTGDTSIESGTIAAATTSRSGKKIADRSAVPKSSKTQPDIKRSAKSVQERQILSANNKSKNLIRAKTKSVQEPSVKIVKKELDKREKFLLSFDGSKMYIWKTKDGIIGFSNIQYPEEKKLAIYRDQNWIEYVGN